MKLPSSLAWTNLRVHSIVVGEFCDRKRTILKISQTFKSKRLVDDNTHDIDFLRNLASFKRENGNRICSLRRSYKRKEVKFLLGGSIA